MLNMSDQDPQLTSQTPNRNNDPASREAQTRWTHADTNNSISQAGTNVNSEIERLEAMSLENEPITVEEAKKATGFGEYGAKVVADLANSDGMTFSRARDAVKNAYMAGFTNLDSSKVNFETETQINAFTAGKQDRLMQDTSAKENAKTATVYDGEVVENKYFKKLSPADQEQHHQIAKDLGLSMDFVDRLVAGETIVLVFAKGTITNPVITSVMVIFEYDETSLDIARRNIYDLERRGIQQKVGETFRRYNAEDFGAYNDGAYLESGGHNNENRLGGRSSEEASSNEETTKVSYSLKGSTDKALIKEQDNEINTNQTHEIKASSEDELLEIPVQSLVYAGSYRKLREIDCKHQKSNIGMSVMKNFTLVNSSVRLSQTRERF